MIKSFAEGNLEVQEVDRTFSYLPDVTARLDEHSGEIDEAFVKDVVLWKLNRFPDVDEQLLSKLRQLPRDAHAISESHISDVVQSLTRRRGFGLPMASAVLRFINREAFQIIDRRAYRVLTGKNYREPKSPKAKADYYLNYLSCLCDLCQRVPIKFSQADRVLYELDKRVNKNTTLYGSRRS